MFIIIKLFVNGFYHVTDVLEMVKPFVLKRDIIMRETTAK